MVASAGIRDGRGSQRTSCTGVAGPPLPRARRWTSPSPRPRPCPPSRPPAPWLRHRRNRRSPRQCRRNGTRLTPTSCSRSLVAGRSWRSPPSRRPGRWPCYRSGSTRCGGLASQDEGHGLFVPEMLAEQPRAASPARIATTAAIASASAEKFRQLGWCENGEAPVETTNSCHPAADAAQASMRAPQACSFSPVANNNTSHSRASSMHLTQWLDQASAVGSFLANYQANRSRRYNFEPAPRAPYHWAVVSLQGRVNGNHRPTAHRISDAEIDRASVLEFFRGQLRLLTGRKPCFDHAMQYAKSVRLFDRLSLRDHIFCVSAMGRARSATGDAAGNEAAAHRNRAVGARGKKNACKRRGGGKRKRISFSGL